MAAKRQKNTRAARLAEERSRQAARARRQALVIWGAAAVLVVAIAGAVTFAIIHEQSTRPSLAAVETFEVEQGHTTEPVTYAQAPPAGGEHHPVWLNCGVYTEPVPEDHAVHSLEHGAVWVTYQPDLAVADVQTLEDALPDTYTILSPHEGLTAPVVASAWGVQLRLDGADDPRLEAFVTEYRQGPQTPEPGALCTGGTDRAVGSGAGGMDDPTQESATTTPSS